MPGSTARVRRADADQHHLNQEVPLRHRELLQRRDVLQAGVVDQHVDRARQRASAAATLASDVTSSATASADPPLARIRAATASAVGRSRRSLTMT